MRNVCERCGDEFVDAEYLRIHQSRGRSVNDECQPKAIAVEYVRNSRYITASVRREVRERDGDQCVRCGSRDGLEFDHIMPHSAGGHNGASNLQQLCKVCNRTKGTT